MALNDLIAQGAQFKQPDLMAQFANIQQLQSGQQANQLNQMKMQEMQRSLTEQEGLRNYLSTSPDLYSPQARAEMLKHGQTGLAYGKAMDEAQKAQVERQKAGTDLVDAKLKQSRLALEGVSSPEQYLQWHQANHSDPVLGKWLSERGATPEKARANIETALQTPGGFEQLLFQSKIGSEKALENHFMEMKSGKQNWTMTVPKYGAGTPAQIIPGTIVNQTTTPGEDLSASTQRRGQDITAGTAANALAWQKDVPGQARMAGAKETATETAKADVALTTAQKQEATGAAKALKEVNYDPKTKSDDMVKLIKKSTSGWSEHLASGAIGATTGSATEGKVAIAKLAAIANKMTLDVMGGKLGAGISNTDRDFITGALASVADPTAPANARLAAWKSVQERLVKASANESAKPVRTIHDQADAILGIK